MRRKPARTVDYRAVTAEDLAAEGARFDVVLRHGSGGARASTLRRSSPTPARMVKPGGLFFCSTLNRTLKSFALAIVGAEYVLRWVPPGTHQWEKFVTPRRTGRLRSRPQASTSTTLTGVIYNPLRDTWDLSRDLDVNYMVVARKLMQMA